MTSQNVNYPMQIIAGGLGADSLPKNAQSSCGNDPLVILGVPHSKPLELIDGCT